MAALPPPTPAALAEARRHTGLLAAAGVGLVGQCYLLVPPAQGGGWLVWALALVLATVAITWFRPDLPGWAWAGILAGAVGGLGMELGHLIDGALSPAAEFCAPVTPGGTGLMLPVVNWSTGLMLAACLASCRWLCPGPLAAGLWRSWFGHAGCLLAMWLGMIAGGSLLRAAGWSSVGGMIPLHVAMVAGMMVGAGVVHAALYPRSRPA